LVETARQNAGRVGYFGHWVVVRGASKLALRRLRLHPAPEECAPGWRYAYGDGAPHDLAALVLRAANAGDGVAAGVSVHEGDYAEVVAVGTGLVAKLAIRPDRASGDLAHDPEVFAHWSWSTPRPLSAEVAREIVERGDLPAEQTAEELFDQLGLPAPYDPLAAHGSTADVETATGKAPRLQSRSTTESVGATGFGGYLATLGFMTDAAAADGAPAWRELRYLPGLGQGFLGIWDRESPAEPLATFVVSRRGEARLLEELGRLQPELRVASKSARSGAPSGEWYDRFDLVEGTAATSGERLVSAVFAVDEIVGVVVAAEHGHEGEAAAYLFRPGDGSRHIYSLERLVELTAMLERYLGEVELSEWIPVPDGAPNDLGGLGPVVLALAGLSA
jgi:hypothetical protein